MRALISITPSSIGDTTVQTVNARDLHAFLEVGKDFSNWIKDRIEQYGFVQNQDYVVFANSGENPQGGRPAKEYALTLDMGKELSMVERTAKGKQARQYFIECERSAKQAAPVLPPIRQTSEAARAFNAVFRTMRLIGCDKNAAAISANQTIRKVAGVDLLALGGQTHLVAENQTSLYYTPTELGQQMGGIPARQVNLLLAGIGLQVRVGEQWQPMETARDFVRIYDTGKRHGNGAPIQQLKWAAAVVPLLNHEEAA